MTKASSAAFRVGVVAAALAVLLEGYPSAQYGRARDPYPPEWESDQFRVRRLSIAPGSQVTDPGAVDSVLVVLTADLDGRMPPAEAIWQPAGARRLENRGRARFDAIVVDVKAAPPAAPMTPPEAVSSTDRIDSRRLIDNERVLVTRLRYAPVTSLDPMHFHARDTLVAYLKGGYVWAAANEEPRVWYPWPWLRSSPALRVDRGDVDVVPANTLHTFSNGGGDPLEFLAVFVK